MDPDVRYLVLVVATVATVASVAHGQGTSSWHSVRGPDLRPLFAKRELADGVHYAYRFNADGTFTGFNMGKRIKGTWRAEQDEFCWTVDRKKPEEECFEVQTRGRSVRLLRDGSEVLSATITP